jgi:hypothetical protein
MTTENILNKDYDFDRYPAEKKHMFKTDQRMTQADDDTRRGGVGR